MPKLVGLNLAIHENYGVVAIQFYPGEHRFRRYLSGRVDEVAEGLIIRTEVRDR